MKEISYRAFESYYVPCSDFIESKMYYDVQFLYDWSYENTVDANSENTWENGGGVSGTCFGELLLDETIRMMEYIGYKDTKFNKIYEFDICKYYEGGIWHYGVIEWLRGGFNFRVLHMGDESVDWNEYFQTLAPETGDYMFYQFEVIGNIYEIFDLYSKDDWLIAIEIANRYLVMNPELVIQ
jgi:YopX protein